MLIAFPLPVVDSTKKQIPARQCNRKCHERNEHKVEVGHQYSVGIFSKTEQLTKYEPQQKMRVMLGRL